MLRGNNWSFPTPPLALSALRPSLAQRDQRGPLNGWMRHGTNLTRGYRQVGTYCGLILKGAKPSDLPVVQEEKLDLVFNLKAAKALVSPSRSHCSRVPTRSSNEKARIHRGARRCCGVAFGGFSLASSSGWTSTIVLPPLPHPRLPLRLVHRRPSRISTAVSF